MDSEKTQITETKDPDTVSGKPAREQWARKLEFMLSAVGFAVGLGNIWRFPYLCYSNGGGAFLIPYVLMLAFLGIPLFYLELALGQYASLGSISVWKLAPIFKGIGYAMNTVNFLTSIYYNVVISYCFFYLFASFTTTLPWASCGNWWNDHRCFHHDEISAYLLTSNNTTMNSTMDNSTKRINPAPNVTANLTLQTPATQYWNNYVLGLSAGMEQLGAPRWHLTLCLLLAWVVVFLCIIKGIKSAGKVAYFTATFPYVVLLILFFRGVTLPGAVKGVVYYVKPTWEKMRHVKIWKDAAIQIMYSLGTGFGGLISLSSFNKFKNNCQKDAIAISLINCSTSVFAGFVIFSVLGHMAAETGASMEDVASDGPGLAFIAYPEALARMAGGPFWSFLFFFMLILLGVNSQFVGVQCMIAAIRDDFPWLMKRKTRFTLAMCVILFFLGIPCTTEGGIYLLQLMDKYATTFPLLIITLFETLVLCWVYGWRRYRSDLAAMLGFQPSMYWIACWAAISPILIFCLLVFSCVEYGPPTYKMFKWVYVYPKWAESLGWVMSMTSIIMIPLWAIIKFARCVGSLKNLWWVIRGPSELAELNLRSLWTPKDDWGPALKEHRNAQDRNLADVAAAYTPNTDDSLQPVHLHINDGSNVQPTVIPSESHI